MKEIKDIIAAYGVAMAGGMQCALATVVGVEGSSYRREGARMLIREDGQLTGAISGGCLEGDALRKALFVMAQAKPMLVTYDTNDEDDAKLGLGLGCNGIIHILIEPIDRLQALHPIALLETAAATREPSVIVTLFSHDRTAAQRGTCLLAKREAVKTALPDDALRSNIEADAVNALAAGESLVRNYSESTAFHSLIKPALSLLIFGAGSDAIPLTQIARVLGWEATVVDGRPAYATPERFPDAARVLHAKPEAALQALTVDAQTAVVLMTHNYNYDLAMLRQFLSIEALQYIGVLGPKKKLQRMLDELADEGIRPKQEQLARVHGPVGLDIGASTPEEIALSIASEIQAVLARGTGVALRERAQPIHA